MREEKHTRHARMPHAPLNHTPPAPQDTHGPSAKQPPPFHCPLSSSSLCTLLASSGAGIRSAGGPSAFRIAVVSLVGGIGCSQSEWLRRLALASSSAVRSARFAPEMHQPAPSGPCRRSTALRPYPPRTAKMQRSIPPGRAGGGCTLLSPWASVIWSWSGTDSPFPRLA